MRWIVGGLVAAATALSAALPSLTGVPTWVGVVLAVLLATAGALGLVPPQAGGVQHGLVNPALKSPPGSADTP